MKLDWATGRVGPAGAGGEETGGAAAGGRLARRPGTGAAAGPPHRRGTAPGLEVSQGLAGPRGHLGPPGLPAVHGGEGHAEQVSELFLAQAALGPQLAEPCRRRFGRAFAGRLPIHARSL